MKTEIAKNDSEESMSSNSGMDHSHMNDSKSASGCFRQRLFSGDSANKQLGGSIRSNGLEFSSLPKILQAVTLGRWRSSEIGKQTFSRSKFVDTVTIEDPLSKALQSMHENINAFSIIVITNKERTMASASLSTKNLLKFMVNNYQGNLL